ncbi:PREDICTED: stathmin domain-containing protein 1 [Chaetura pelagica]|uniref:stathmin domain-containing protein 1 n=1 Tax=Chaetura pelagica TaxID=8897 RepID=UPI00052395E9|nr:PREDICTED: stathmin domain-containing protein 1 [Chaetura pelagica]
MGCSISNRAAVAPLPSEDLQSNQEAQSQTKNDSISGTGAFPSQDGPAGPTSMSKDKAKLQDETSERDSPEELPERLKSSQESSNAQNTDALLTSKVISKAWPLQETERQNPSDILEELRMHGIIKSQSTAARTGEAYENKRDALEKTLKKPQARLEKIQKEELNKMPQQGTFFFPATAHQSRGKQTEKDSPSFESQGVQTLLTLTFRG